MEYIREVAAARVARKTDRELLQLVSGSYTVPIQCPSMEHLSPPAGVQLLEERCAGVGC